MMKPVSSAAEAIGLYMQNSEQLETGFYSFTPNLDGQNFIAQAYNHLKTLPEFSGATDC